MKKLIFLSLVLFFIVQSSSFAQMAMPDHVKGKMTYPALDFNPWVGVIPIENSAMPYDPSLEYKIALDLYGRIKDSTQIHSTITEIGRTYNLHIANGVPADKIKIVVVIHGGISLVGGTDAAYQERYGIDNPNMIAIKALEEVGVQFYMCGQSMSFWKVSASSITPEVKIALSAKTTFVMLDQMGYSYLDVGED